MDTLAEPHDPVEHRFKCQVHGEPAVRFPSWLPRHVPAGAFRLYLELAWLADADGRAVTSRAELAEAIGVGDPKVVSRRVKQLEDAGALLVDRSWSTERGHDTNAYQLLVESPKAPLPRQSVEIEADRIAGVGRLDIAGADPMETRFG